MSVLAASRRAQVARGVVFVHACARAVCPHVEWTLTELLGSRVTLDWTPQPVLRGAARAELSWTGEAGLGSSIASALRAFPDVRFEVTEEPTAGRDGERYAFTPSLGLFRSTVGVHGDLLVNEDRLRSALSSGAGLADEIARLLGTPWDTELEPFRYAGDGVPVRWLHQVG